ncbi:LysR family transcriptional regulator [Pseudoflavonifractor phocaeensis]|uniref:LysR family transcriptional regulator n=1 Tax=Pseudoflavonifractor phocaeensis TaxID=1870988 RepID=UPI001F16E320|nr:LysR family transcriptional regulator [Pseudoflavonifractor phocaeensis]MCF2596220.1 LysR family transcriptional regulator [Pseudoflavonifractor phocaeensis]
MELRTLRYFITVAQELNITRAAEKLNMSQPPLSNQIRGLEEELGVRLFIRGKRRLALTDEGSLLLRRAVQLLDLADKTRQELATMKDGVSGTICLGMVEGRAPYLSARWIAGFREEFPLVRYSLWNGSSDDVLDRLHKGLADLAVIAAPYDTEHLEGFSVAREPWVAVISRNHPLAQQPGDQLPLSALVGQPLIVPSRKSRIEAIRDWFGEIGAEPDILCEMSNYVDAVALAEQNVGVSIFPQTTYTPNDLVVSKVITQPARQAEYVLVWSKEQRPSGLVQAFIDYVQDFLEEDKIHSRRFRVREEEHVLPQETEYL